MGISHFSGLFVLLCVGVAGALLTLACEHGFYRLVLPHIRRRQNLKYWLHTSQKIHRALNMTYEDVKRQRAEKEKSCNLQKSQPPPGPLAPPAPGASAKWNNETSKDAAAAAAAAATKDARDFKRVHFNLETLNTRRLLARIAASDAKAGTTKAEGEGRAKPKAGPNSRLCENGGPAASFASMVLASARANASASAPAAVAPPPVAVAPPATVAPPPAAVVPARPGELQELQEEIEQMREKLRTALARRAEIQTTLTKPVATTTTTPSPVDMTPTATMTTASTTTGVLPAPQPAVAPLTALPANTKCVMTMTDPPHKVLSKVRPLHSRLANQKR